MRIFVVGTGGLGGYFGGLLAKADNDVTFLARGKHYNVIKERGLKVKTVLGDFIITPAKVAENINEITDPDLIIFTVKTYDTENVARELAKVVDKKTIIISFQNGIDNDNEIKKHIKDAKVFPGLAFVVSVRTTPGVIEQTGGPRKFIFGDRESPHNQQLKIIEKLMREAEIDASVSSDITSDLWKKFIFITAFSGMTAICRANIGKVLSDQIAAKTYERCVKEAITLALALRVNLPGTIFQDVMGLTKTLPADSKSSLLVDIENNRENEIETLNGTLVRLARKYNIDVPINELIYGAVKLLP